MHSSVQGVSKHSSPWTAALARLCVATLVYVIAFTIAERPRTARDNRQLQVGTALTFEGQGSFSRTRHESWIDAKSQDPSLESSDESEEKGLSQDPGGVNTALNLPGPNEVQEKGRDEEKGSSEPSEGKGSEGLVCPCVKPEHLPFKHVNDDPMGDVLLPFWKEDLNKDFTRPWNFGSYCGPHDSGTSPQCDGKAWKTGNPKVDERSSFGSTTVPEWCGLPWCFVYEECACGEAFKKKGGKMRLDDAFATDLNTPLGRWMKRSIPLYDGYENKKRADGSEIHVWFTYLNCGAMAGNVSKQHKRDHCGVPDKDQCDQNGAECLREGDEGSDNSRARLASLPVAVLAVVAVGLIGL